MPVKPGSLFIYCINHDGRGGDLGRLGKSALERIHKKKFSGALSLVTVIDGETAQERDWDYWIRRKSFDHFFRKIMKIDSK